MPLITIIKCTCLLWHEQKVSLISWLNRKLKAQNVNISLKNDEAIKVSVRITFSSLCDFRLITIIFPLLYQTAQYRPQLQKASKFGLSLNWLNFLINYCSNCTYVSMGYTCTHCDEWLITALISRWAAAASLILGASRQMFKERWGIRFLTLSPSISSNLFSYPHSHLLSLLQLLHLYLTLLNKIPPYSEARWVSYFNIFL